MSYLARIPLVITMTFSLAWLPIGYASAKDLEDILEGVGASFGITTAFDHNVFGLGTCGDSGSLCVDAELTGFDSLAEFNANIVNDRVVPLSSSVTGFTYEYNEDLDIFERSTKTFGPLFNERADTIGRGRMMAGLSYSFFKFDEFEGESLSGVSAEFVQGSLRTTEGVTLTSQGQEFQGRTVGEVLGLLDAAGTVDIIYDLDIEETVASFQFTYGLTDRIDFGFVLPVLRIDFKASAMARVSEGSLTGCSDLPADRFESNDLCIGEGATSVVSESEDYLGIGDLVLRGKWHFLDSFMDAAALMTATIPTGSVENLTGFHTMTFKPGVVMSRDFEMSWGGLGLHSSLAYEIRPDKSENTEIEWGIGLSIQPAGRMSLNVDVLGSEKVRNSSFGQSRHDISMGGKFMLFPGVLANLNLILPLNDDGLRPDAIYSAQLEWVFGD